MPGLCMNVWPVLNGEAVQQINTAHPLVVPHKAAGLTNINSLFFDVN